MHASGVTLLIADLPTLSAALEGAEPLSRALGGCAVADGWEAFPEALPAARAAVAEDPESARWGTRLFILDEPRTLVGWGGFKGPPADGVVELGYAVAPAFRGRGIAGDAVLQMLDDAFSDDRVNAVIAHTLAAPGPSTRVLAKTGFAHDGEVDGGEDGRVWRWRQTRSARQAEHLA
jgi:[ribosomal protein S5]-alanine N-acetyltransferase